MKNKPGFWKRLWRRLRKKCVYCGGKIEYAHWRSFTTGTEIGYCPNGHMMKQWSVDYMWGEHGGLEKEFYDDRFIPGWACKHYEKLHKAKIIQNLPALMLEE